MPKIYMVSSAHHPSGINLVGAIHELPLPDLYLNQDR
jgi:hypothetical protein